MVRHVSDYVLTKCGTGSDYPLRNLLDVDVAIDEIFDEVVVRLLHRNRVGSENMSPKLCLSWETVAGTVR